MKIALASAPVKNRDMDFNLQAMLDTLEQCSGNADLILFGEAVLQGFDSLCWDYETDRLMAVSLTDASVQRMCKAAKEHSVAVSFGFIEHGNDALYSSQIFIDSDGRIKHVFRRVSIGWKVCACTDPHYREGTGFQTFSYRGKTFAIGLCGDLWTAGRPEEMNALNADAVLWPVWCDYEIEEWNNCIKYEYAAQAALCGKNVFLVNPFCAGANAECCAAGAGIHFCGGTIVVERPAGAPGTLIVDFC